MRHSIRRWRQVGEVRILLLHPGKMTNDTIYPLQSTPALRTPRYYGHPAITDSSKIPGESYRRLTEINSRYYGLSLLRTYGHFIRSQRHNCIVFSLVIADTEQHLGIFAHISSLFFLLFETVFVSFGRFPLLLSINQNSFIFFS